METTVITNKEAKGFTVNADILLKGKRVSVKKETHQLNVRVQIRLPLQQVLVAAAKTFWGNRYSNLAQPISPSVAEANTWDEDTYAAKCQEYTRKHIAQNMRDGAYTFIAESKVEPPKTTEDILDTMFAMQKMFAERLDVPVNVVKEAFKASADPSDVFAFVTDWKEKQLAEEQEDLEEFADALAEQIESEGEFLTVSESN